MQCFYVNHSEEKIVNFCKKISGNICLVTQNLEWSNYVFLLLPKKFLTTVCFFDVLFRDTFFS